MVRTESWDFMTAFWKDFERSAEFLWWNIEWKYAVVYLLSQATLWQRIILINVYLCVIISHFYLVLSLLSCVILVRSSLITNQGRLRSRPEFWYSGLLHYFICMYLPTSLLSEVGVNCPLGRSRLWAMELYFRSAIDLSNGHLTSTERSFRPFYTESRDSAQNAPHLYINVGKSLLMFLWS